MPPCDGTMGYTCSGTTGSRTCAQITYVGNGMPCGSMNNTFFGCAGGGDCYTALGRLAESGESGTCKAPAADGAACDLVSGPLCLPRARCVVFQGGTAGVCTVPNGLACT